MLKNLVKKVFGSANDRLINTFRKNVAAINALEDSYIQLTDDELKAKTGEFRERLAKGETLDDLLVEAFATVRETSKRVLGKRHYDVQLMGGMVLHKGMISEMKTGEGKTLVAPLAVYLNALPGKGVHVVTVNDYLALRDSEWMGKIYKFLGLSVGCILSGMDDHERQQAYSADVTNGTNNEFGFDYLRDNMKFRIEDMVQRPFNYAIVDEMDSILIDEARTPLIISGPTEDSSEMYVAANSVVKRLAESDYEKDEKHHNVTLNDSGMQKAEDYLREMGLIKGASLYDIQNVSCVHHINQALKATTLFHKDKDYIVKDSKVIIIDEFTGRMMDGRRYSDGLHQAIEAKENVPIQMENQTLASITFQNYFRLYPKLAGMTGTAMTEAAEFSDIYKLEVVELPTNKPCVRKDYDDEVYRTEKEKFNSIITLIKECQERKQPVLVGTASIEKSEKLSAELKKNKIPHQVLNARYHEQEAQIIAEAGCPNAVTIATNMAGRGTDIQLGGNLEVRLATEVDSQSDNKDQVKLIQKITAEIERDAEIVREAGGLYVIGTERHESRRIDNQLRGRSGRQGDPGASKFFLSLEDDLMRIFGSERLDSMLQKLGLEEGEAIIHPWVNKAIERAQTKVEARNYDMRKHLLKYDDVMNDQRKVIYEQRKEIMQTDSVADVLLDMREEVIETLVATYIPEKSYHEDWDVAGLHEEILRVFGLMLPVQDWAKEEGIADLEIRTRLQKAVDEHFENKFSSHPQEMVHHIEKSMLLRLLDQVWKDHLLNLDHLRQGINLRAYAQRDPLNEYKSEAFTLFDGMLNNLKMQVTSVLSQFGLPEKIEPDDLLPQENKHLKETRHDPALGEGDDMMRESVMVRKPSDDIVPGDPSTWGRVPRNAPCPCKSGEKYKNCHGRL